MAKKIKYLIVHCTDTRASFRVNKSTLIQWHMVERGWDRLGYSDLIHRDGRIENLTAYDDDDIVDRHEITWGAAGVNSISRHVCLEGGRDSKNKGGVFLFEQIFTDTQFTALVGYVKTFLNRYPGTKVAPHSLFSTVKTCPNFDLASTLELAGIPRNRILFEVI